MTRVALILIVLVFTAGDVVFLVQALNPAWAAATVAALVGAVGWLYRPAPADLDAKADPREARLEFGWALACLGVATVVCVLGGAGRFLHAPLDWQVRDAVLADMTRGPWPVNYARGGAAWVLRCPLGFYELPGLVGRALGVRAAHLAVLGQEAALFGAVLHLVGRRAAPGWRRALVLAIFVAFSGADIVGAAIWGGYTLGGAPPFYAFHIERWASGMEYSSFLTGLYWAPNHTLPAFTFVGLYLAWRDKAVSSPALAAFAALAFPWSPLAVMGMAPFVAFALLEDLRARALDLRALAVSVLAGAALLPAVAFSQLASGGVPHGPTFAEPRFWPRYGLFAALEILPLAYLALRSGYGATRLTGGERALAAGALFLIPLYRIGLPNDFMMRASVVALGLLAAAIGERAVACVEARRRGPLAVMAVVLGLGGVTPAYEIAANLVTPPAPIVTATVPQALARSIFHYAPVDTYLAPAQALEPWRWLLKPVRSPARR